LGGCASIYGKLGKPLESLKYVDIAIKLEPTKIKWYNDKGITLAGIRRLDEAIENFDKALENLDKAIENHHDISVLWSNKGQTLHQLEKYDQAIRCYDMALKIDPTNSTAKNNKQDAARGIRIK
jgi:tetratricopeptide (TPR) repeat protein